MFANILEDLLEVLANIGPNFDRQYPSGYLFWFQKQDKALSTDLEFLSSDGKALPELLEYAKTAAKETV